MRGDEAQAAGQGASGASLGSVARRVGRGDHARIGSGDDLGGTGAGSDPAAQADGQTTPQNRIDAAAGVPHQEGATRGQASGT